MTIARDEVERIARVVHEALRAWGRAHDDHSLPPWDEAEDWMIASTLEAVSYRIAHPKSRPGGQHRRWMAERKAQGWRHGAVKDPKEKTHPMLVPFSQLPDYEKRKDALIHAVVDALVRPMPG